jgi:hypothetical protein
MTENLAICQMRAEIFMNCNINLRGNLQIVKILCILISEKRKSFLKLDFYTDCSCRFLYIIFI